MPFHISPDYAPSRSEPAPEPEQVRSKYARLEEPTWKQPFIKWKPPVVNKVRTNQPNIIYCMMCGKDSHLPATFCKSCGVKLVNPVGSMDKHVVWLSSVALTLVFTMAIALRANDSTREAWAMFIGLSFVAALIALAFVTWRRILSQAGYPSWFAIFTPIPPVSVVALLYMGYNEWPVSRKTRELEAECASLRLRLEMKTADVSNEHN